MLYLPTNYYIVSYLDIYVIKLEQFDFILEIYPYINVFWQIWCFTFFSPPVYNREKFILNRGTYKWKKIKWKNLG
jgi:hypothetical protein